MVYGRYNELKPTFTALGGTTLYQYLHLVLRRQDSREVLIAELRQSLRVLQAEKNMKRRGAWRFASRWAYIEICIDMCI